MPQDDWEDLQLRIGGGNLRLLSGEARNKTAGAEDLRLSPGLTRSCRGTRTCSRGSRGRRFPDASPKRRRSCSWSRLPPASASDDATLSGLALKNADDDDAIALNPAFDASATVTVYAASVANTVTRVTVEATASSSAATVEYLDGDGAAIEDADGKEGHQVDLEAGANEIQVKVTAGDGVSMSSTRVFVTRALDTAPDPAAIWSATLTPVGPRRACRVLPGQLRRKVDRTTGPACRTPNSSTPPTAARSIASIRSGAAAEAPSTRTCTLDGSIRRCRGSRLGAPDASHRRRLRSRCRGSGKPRLRGCQPRFRRPITARVGGRGSVLVARRKRFHRPGERHGGTRAAGLLRRLRQHRRHPERA